MVEIIVDLTSFDENGNSEETEWGDMPERTWIESEILSHFGKKVRVKITEVRDR